MIRRLAFTPAKPASRSHARLWLAACAGSEPADALPTRDREDLVYDLWSCGWTDQDIALHTRMTEYTTARIRTRLGLPARYREVRHAG